MKEHKRAKIGLPDIEENLEERVYLRRGLKWA
jgi:hypothetical protein